MRTRPLFAVALVAVMVANVVLSAIVDQSLHAALGWICSAFYAGCAAAAVWRR